MVRGALPSVLAALAVSVPIVHAGEQLRVVVNELDANGVSRQVARVVSDHLRVKLIETRRFIIPEREKMEAVLQEQAVGMQLGECFSQECAIELGRLMQANKMIVGTVSLLNRTYSISIRFLDLETGTAEFSAEEKCQSVDDLFLAAERLAARIVAFVPPRGKVTAVSDGNIIVDLGKADGVIPGMTFRILRTVERVPGYPEEEQIATARATSVQETWSRLELQGRPTMFMRGPSVKVGDIVIGPQTPTVTELPQYAYLMVYSRPVGAEVYVDNLFRGRTKADGLEIKLKAGRHTVRISAPAHKPDERTVELQPNQRMPYHATLQPRLPRRTFRLPITMFSYLRQRPTDERFRGQLDGEALQGVEFSIGRIYSRFLTEFGVSWTHANMAPGQGYGLNEVHRLSTHAQAGLAIPMGTFIPYIAIGYEAAQYLFNERDALDNGEALGEAGKIGDNGGYVDMGLFVRRWLRVSYHSSWGRTETDLKMFTIGLNLSGF